jgi:hypothetical protein
MIMHTIIAGYVCSECAKELISWEEVETHFKTTSHNNYTQISWARVTDDKDPGDISQKRWMQK